MRDHPPAVRWNRTGEYRSPGHTSGNRTAGDRIAGDRIGGDRIGGDRIGGDRIGGDRIGTRGAGLRDGTRKGAVMTSADGRPRTLTRTDWKALALDADTRTALRAAVAALLALLVGDFDRLPRPYWAVFIAVVLINGTWGQNVRKSVSRWA